MRIGRQKLPLWTSVFNYLTDLLAIPFSQYKFLLSLAGGLVLIVTSLITFPHSAPNLVLSSPAQALAPAATEPVVSLTSPTAFPGLTVIPNGVQATTSANLSVTTNNPTGYKLSVKSATNETCLRNSTNYDPASGNPNTACSGISSYNKINQLTVDNQTSLPNNSWGLSLNSGYNWRIVPPNNSTDGLIIKTTTTAATNPDISTITAGIKVDHITAANQYAAKLQLTALPNLSDIPAPTISSISPSSGLTSGGTAITVTGSNFIINGTAVVYSLKLDNLACDNLIITSAMTLDCDTPAHSAGQVAATVNSWGGEVSLLNAFNYVALPAVASVSPTSGPITGSTPITITGANFTGATAVSICTTFTVASATSITCNTNAHAEGNVPVVVTTAAGNSIDNVDFTYYTPPPTITSVSPDVAVAGDTVTFFGTNLINISALKVGGVNCTSFAAVSSTEATCVMPSLADGEKALSVTTDYGSYTTTSPIFVAGFHPVMSFRFDGGLVDDWDSSVIFESPYATPNYVSGTTYSSAVNRGSCGSTLGSTNRCPFYINAAGAAKIPSSPTYSGLKSNLTVAFRMKNAGSDPVLDFNMAFVQDKNDLSVQQTTAKVIYGYNGDVDEGFRSIWKASSSGYSSVSRSNWFGNFSNGAVNDYIFQVADTASGFSTKFYKEGAHLQTESYGTGNMNFYVQAQNFGFNLAGNSNGFMDFILIFDRVLSDFEISKLNTKINDGSLYSNVYQP